MPYLTPDTIADTTICYSIRIPDNDLAIAAFMGAVSELAKVWNWELFGEMTPEEMAAEFATIYQDMAENPGRGCMIGEIVTLATTALPSGVLACDGTQHLRVDYPDLYAALDAAFIVDADNFVTPNLVDRMVLGDGVLAVNASGGAKTHTLTSSEMPSHSHGYTSPVMGVVIDGAGVPVPAATSTNPFASTGNSGSGNAHNNMPPYLVLRFGIVAI